MDFKNKMSNVAFGGDWSEQLSAQHDTTQSFAALQWAIDNCREQDVDTEEVRDALAALTNTIEKGGLLRDRFSKGHKITDQSLRHKHLYECVQLIKRWY
jgi:hypothetical protein